MAFSIHWPKVDRNRARRSVGSYGMRIQIKLPCRFETEEPAEAELVSAGVLVLRQVRTAGVQREVYPSHEGGLAQTVFGTDSGTGVSQEFDIAAGDGIILIGDGMARVAECGETYPLEQLLLVPVEHGSFELQVGRDQRRHRDRRVIPAQVAAARHVIVHVGPEQERAPRAEKRIGDPFQRVGAGGVDLALLGGFTVTAGADSRVATKTEPPTWSD